MKKLLFGCLVFVAACATQKLSSGLAEVRTLALGSIDVVDLDFIPDPNFILGNAQFLSVQLGKVPEQILVLPQKRGSSSLVIRDQSGRVRKNIIYNIIPNDLSGKLNATREMLRNIEGLKVVGLNDKIVLDGEILVPREMDRILKVQQAYPDVVVNLVTLSKELYLRSAKQMETEIQKDPDSKGIFVNWMQDTFFLVGSAPSEAHKVRAETIAQTFLPEIMASPAIAEGVLVPGARKFSLRDFIVVTKP